jgi:predicted ATP-dependent serine protease
VSLASGLLESVSGIASVVLLGGEAGVGKSRLVDRFAESARAGGARVLLGAVRRAGRQRTAVRAATSAWEKAGEPAHLAVTLLRKAEALLRLAIAMRRKPH